MKGAITARIFPRWHPREPSTFVTINVRAAPESRQFIVHKNAIYYYSAFFEKAFNSEFIEGQTQTMTLDDVDDSTSGLLANWCYTQKLEHATKAIKLVELAEVWTLAERFFMPKLQYYAMESMCMNHKREVQKTDQLEFRELVDYAYVAEDDSEATPLKRVVIGKFLVHMTGEEGVVSRGKYEEIVDYFFGSGPAQDLLKVFLKHYEVEISNRCLFISRSSDSDEESAKAHRGAKEA
jgi:hypothetical protein